MLLFRPMNDLHNEIKLFDIPALPTDKDTILSLAGDIYDRKRLMPWLEMLSKRFKHVVMAMGNHDYWNGSYDLVKKHHLQYLKEHDMSNVHILFDDYVVIDDVMFFGGTMWTDMNNRDPLTIYNHNQMNDYRKIRTNSYGRRLTPAFILDQHMLFKARLKDAIDDANIFAKDLIVISHHSPCTMSICDRYLHDRIMNGFYVTAKMSDVILDAPCIKLWHHGHLHNVSDYMLGDTRVICNPSGYKPYEDIKGFNPELVIDLHTLTELA